MVTRFTWLTHRSAAPPTTASVSLHALAAGVSVQTASGGGVCCWYPPLNFDHFEYTLSISCDHMGGGGFIYKS